MGVTDAVRREWRKPPNEFQRWAAAHPILWSGIVVAIVGIPSVQSWPRDGLVYAIGGVILLACGLAAFGGACIARLKVLQYDSQQPGATRD